MIPEPVADYLGPPLIDGEPSWEIPVTDRAVAYGDGLFETLLVRQGTPLFWKQHLHRMQAGCRRLDLPTPEPGLLAGEVRRLLHLHRDCVIKILLTRGSGGRGYRCPEPAQSRRILSAHPCPQSAARWQSQGLSLRVCTTPLAIGSPLAGIKHLNRLEQILARQEWAEECWDEGVMCDAEGWVVEGTMSNLYWFRGGELCTPLLDRCGIEGVMRGVLLELASAAGIPVRVGRYTLEHLREADEIFVSNSVLLMAPAVRLEERRLPVGALTRHLRVRLDACIARECQAPWAA